MPMIDTAEVVANRYGIGRDAQDGYALQSQQRTAAGQANGKFDDEIVPLSSTKGVMDRETGEIGFEDVVLAKDEGNRPETSLEGLSPTQSGSGRRVHYGRECESVVGRGIGLRRHGGGHG